MVGRERWVVLTKDRRIRYRNLERRALMQAGVAAFILTAGDLTGEEMAGVFVAALPTMKRFLAMHDPPFIAAITRGGRASLILDSSNRLKGRDE